jgi:hypothetical protein
MAYDKVKIRRGVKANLPALEVGELAYCTDTKEQYTGDYDGNQMTGRAGLPAAFDILNSDVAARAVNVKSHGAVGDGIANDTVAINAAIAVWNVNRGTLYFPKGTYIYNGSISIPKSCSIVGAGCNTDGSGTLLRINAANQWAISNTEGTGTIKDLYIIDNGGTSGGVYAYSQLLMSNVIVSGFTLPNLLLEQDATQNGPYNSIIMNCRFHYSLSYGAVIGNGANNVTMINCQYFWNGWVAHDPDGSSGTNNLDGCYVGIQYNPNARIVANPQSTIIIGGDASYNSRHGWNIGGCDGADMILGYAEANAHANEVRIGANVINSTIKIKTVDGGLSGVLLETVDNTSIRTNAIWYGGLLLGGGNAAGSLFSIANRFIFIGDNLAAGLNHYFNPVKDGGGAFTNEVRYHMGGANAKMFVENGASKIAEFNTNFEIGSAWNGPHFVMGTFHLWVDGMGRLRIKNGVPANDTDGAVVGLQA